MAFASDAGKAQSAQAAVDDLASYTPIICAAARAAAANKVNIDSYRFMLTLALTDIREHSLFPDLLLLIASTCLEATEGSEIERRGVV